MDADLNSKGDAAVTQALSQGFGMFVPPAMFPMLSRSLSSNPFPLNAARCQPYFLISLFSLPCDSRIKLPSSSTWLFVSALLNSAGPLSLAEFQMTSVTTKVTPRVRW